MTESKIVRERLNKKGRKIQTKGAAMPIYEYECESCKHRFEELQDMNAAAPSACPKCKGSVRKLLSASTPLSSKKGSSGQTCRSRDERCGGSPSPHGPCGGGKCCGQ